jgi:hypothetical protein
MYPECRHVRPSGEGCRAAALQGSHWCYFHARMHSRHAQRQAERDRLHAIRRETARRQHRQPNGRFATVLAFPPHSSVDARSSQSSHPQTATDATGNATPTQTCDYGAVPVTSAGEGEEPAAVEASLDLPPIEDAASIQLALIEVLQALAANQIETRRAGLLLYGLQVASANAKHINISRCGVRSITHTDDGIPLGPQEYGYDLEDIEEEIQEAEEVEEDQADGNVTARRHIFGR